MSPLKIDVHILGKFSGLANCFRSADMGLSLAGSFRLID